MRNLRSRQLMYLIIMLGLTPLSFWVINCDSLVFNYPWSTEEQEARCFSLDSFIFITTGIVTSLMVLAFWLKYKNEIAGETVGDR